MELNTSSKELVIIIFASLILSLSYLFPLTENPITILTIFLGFFLIIGINILIKKLVAYTLEAKVETKFWSLERYGFKEKQHFKKPIYMLWLPPLISLMTRGGSFLWMPILEFDIKARIERVAKRHELYRFTQITDWHMGLIVFWGVMANVFLYIILNFFGLSEIAVLSLYYAIWSILPISSLDGTKLLFGDRKLWVIAGIIILIAFFWQSTLF